MDALLIVAVVAGAGCGARMLALELPPGVEPGLRTMARALLRPPPVATIVAVLVVGGFALLQLTVAPGLLGHLERAPADRSGEPWRLVTALVAQDGGVAGAVWNVTALLVVGALAERVLVRPRAIGAWVAGALAGELAGLAWQPVGAGNSVGTFGLVGALAVAALATRQRAEVATAAFALGAGAALVAAADIHGAAMAAGVVAGAAGLALAARPRSPAY